VFFGLLIRAEKHAVALTEWCFYFWSLQRKNKNR